MGKDPAFLFYPNDYMGGTMGMTFEEKGAYMELLMLQFNRGHMTTHMIGQTVGQIWERVASKFVIDVDGLYYNVRLDQEIEKRRNYTESRRNNTEGINQYTKNKGADRGHMTTHMTGHTTGHMEDEDINANEPVNKPRKKGAGEKDFDRFWSAYPRKAGKQAAAKAWAKIRPDADLLTRILDAIATQSKSEQWTKDGGQYIPYPATWLNEGRWDDELPSVSIKPITTRKPGNVGNFTQREYSAADVESLITDPTKEDT